MCHYVVDRCQLGNWFKTARRVYFELQLLGLGLVKKKPVSCPDFCLKEEGSPYYLLYMDFLQFFSKMDTVLDAHCG